MAHAPPGTDDMKAWLEKHHHLIPPSNLNANEVHVFATRAIGAFGEKKSDKVTYDIAFNLGPVTFKYWACFDPMGHKFSVWSTYAIPMNPDFILGYASGNMDNSIMISFDKIPSGHSKFYVKDDWFWSHYDVTIFGRRYVGDIKLVPLECPARCRCPRSKSRY